MMKIGSCLKELKKWLLQRSNTCALALSIHWLNHLAATSPLLRRVDSPAEAAHIFEIIMAIAVLFAMIIKLIIAGSK